MVLSEVNSTRIPFTKLRVIPFNKYKGAFNMALDFYLAEKNYKTKIPILRFYGWNPACISLGYHQSSEMIRGSLIDDKTIQCVRRPTGGSAILHSQELTYSLIMPSEITGHKILYEISHQLMAKAFVNLGIDVELHRRNEKDNYLKKGAETFACFNRPAYTEIKYQGKKLVGSAQKILSGSILQHGSILFDRDQDRIIDYLEVDDNEKKSYLNELRQKSVALEEISDKMINESELGELIIKEFSEAGVNRIYYQNPLPEEIEGAMKLVDQFRVGFN
ncbi:MAG: hypothetical protein JXR46_07350 [Calditrichaceae bacterium]|nr:hypothetical protein [Calditrichaceae bacterium]MBN2708844.1 hypothetical protein [Calditrichaceae bacterium]RQV97629.1 MAG: hypothetical protein EH224_01005 [Calditrichota bacterium]